MYYIPSAKESWGIAGIQGLDLNGTGIPSKLNLLRSYCSFNENMDMATVMQWRGFYLSFLFFKNCVIVHGVSQRAKQGVASSEMASKGMTPHHSLLMVALFNLSLFSYLIILVNRNVFLQLLHFCLEW